MKKILILSALFGSIATMSALPTWEPFVNQPAGGSLYSGANGGSTLANQTNASGEIWYKWTSTSAPQGTSTLVTNFPLANVTLNGYTLPAPYSTLPTNSVYVPNNVATSNGHGACFGFNKIVYPPAGKVSQYGAATTNRVFISFLIDVPNSAGLNSGGGPTYYAGFINAGQVQGNYNGTPPGAPNGQFRFYVGANSSVSPYALGVAGPNGQGLTPGSDFQNSPYESSNTVYFVVIDYEFAGTNISGTMTNDYGHMWISPASYTFGANNTPAVNTAAAGVSIVVPAVDDLTNAGGFYILARASGNSPTNGWYIGDMAFGTTWSYVTGGAELTLQPVSTNANAGQTLVLTSSAAAIAGQNLSYQWTKNGNNLSDGATGNGSTITGSQSSPNLTLSGLAAADAGSYAVSVFTPVSQANNTPMTSSNAIVSVDPLIVSYTTNITVLGGGSGNLIVTNTTAHPGLTYQWQRNGVNLTAGNDGTGTICAGVQTSNLTLSNISTSDSGNNGVSFSCVVSNAVGGFITNGPMTLTAQSLVVSQPIPASLNANYGATVSFAAASTPPGSSYQWLLNGSPVSDPHASGTTTTNLTITGVSYIDAGSYTLFVNNQYTSVLPAVLTVNDPNIVTQPANQQANAGSTAILSVGAAGSPTLSYQWYSNGVALYDVPGVVAGSQSSPSLTLFSVSDADDASYNVVINGGSGVPTNSARATLTVIDPVSVPVPMNSWTVNPGVHIAFAPTVAGTPPFLYQWLYNNTPLAGATNSSLVITNVQTTTNGTYTVLITNSIVGGASHASASATLTVTPTLIAMPANNLIVARVGDGSQTLNTNLGNTLYLDQFTGSGSYVATTMIPDSGPNALVVAGGAPDGLYESFLTASTNDLYINFGGFNTNVLSTNSKDIGSGTIRAIGAVSGLGGYVLALTNGGLHSSTTQMRGVASTDGLYNFWSAGISGGIQYITPFTNQNGFGIPTVVPTGFPNTDLRVVQFWSNSPSTLYFTGGSNDAAAENGLFNFAAGTPTTAAPSVSVYENGTGSGSSSYDANDFAISPDGNVVYIADDNTIANGGGIQRWDGGGLSYILPTGNNSIVGARGIVVNWGAGSGGSWAGGATGETVYATTAETSGNRLIQINDNGSSSTAATLQTAGPNQIFQGLRFGLLTAPMTVTAQPQNQTNVAGTTVTFSVQVSGSAPFTYQWWSNGVAVGSATNASFTITNVTPGAGGGSGYYVIVDNGIAPPATSQTATLTVLTPAPSMATSALQPWIVGASTGARVVFTTIATGAFPLTVTWTSNGVPVYTNVNYSQSVSNFTLSITNPAVAGVFTYQVSAANAYGPTVSASGTLTVLPQATFSTANLVVARVGDGAQTLNTNLGNTLYMDQFKPTGAYVSTVMIPDSGSNALVVAGGTSNGMFESILTLSSNNDYLNLCGFNFTLPNTNDSDVGNSANVRVIGALSASGFYTRCVTNSGLYSAGDQFRSVGSSDGLVNFWTTGGGLASSPGVKYINPTLAPNGVGIPEVAANGPADTRVVQVLSNSSLGSNFLYTTGQSSFIGLWFASGAVQSAATVTQLISETSGSPNDFAVSPDLQTIYIADDSLQSSGGGIQRWDTNTLSGGYSLSYTLADSTGSETNGIRCLVVNWGTATSWGTSVGGETIYATTAEASANRLITFTDNGASPSTDTTLDTAWPNEVYRGIRFGPAAVPLVIVTNPASQSVVVGQTVDFTVAVTGTAPYYYQWYTNNVAIPGATASDYSIASVQMGNAASYTVTISNTVGSVVTSTPAAVLTVNPFAFNSDLVGWWLFNDSTGTTAADSSGYADSGALSNFQASPWVTGFDNMGALNYANVNGGNSNVVLVPDAPQLNFTNNLAFTLAAWIQSATTNQVSGAAIITKGYGNGGEQYAFDIYSNAFRLYVRNAAGASVNLLSTTVPNGQWEHVAATYDGQEGLMALYVNGQSVGSVAAPNSLLFSTNPVSIGNRTSSSTSAYNLPFVGDMQDVRIYKVALGAQDIEALYQNLAVAVSPPHITTNPPAAFIANGQLQINLSGLPNTTYRLWSTTNISLTPVTSTWTLLSSSSFNSSGAASYTDVTATGRTKFYVITQP